MTRTKEMTEKLRQTPRWEMSQIEVEAALQRGPKTIAELVSETGFSYTTVTNALHRAHVTETRDWPRRHSLVKSAFEEGPRPEVAPKIAYLVEPLDIPVEEAGAKWQAGRKKIAKEIADIDFLQTDLPGALAALETEAASLLGIIVALRKVEDGPDWRDQIGLPA